MEFYNGNKQLYLETDPFSVRLGVSLLQVKDRMWFSRNETPYNEVLWPTAFTRKILTSMKACYSKQDERH